MKQKRISPGNGNKLALSCMLLLGLTVAAASVHACTPGDPGFISSGTGGLMDEAIEAGAYLPVSAQGRVTFLKGCPRDSSQKFKVSMNQTYLGEFGGIPTFATDGESRVGAQIKVAGTYIGSGGTEVNVQAGELGSAAADVEVSYIAVRQMPVAIYGFGASSDFFDVTDLNNGLDVPATEVTSTTLQPRRSASCTFASRPPATLAMRDTPVNALDGEGSTGPATDFSFSWTCDRGNDGSWTGGGDFRYKSSTQVAGKPGRIVAGGDDASGVDLLITRKTSSGRYDPIRFDWWYSDGRPLAESGTEELRVQFIRNDDALQPGKASGSMVVEVLMY